jgi:hypothetical protein
MIKLKPSNQRPKLTIGGVVLDLFKVLLLAGVIIGVWLVATLYYLFRFHPILSIFIIGGIVFYKAKHRKA